MNEMYEALTRLRIKHDETSADKSTWGQSSESSWTIEDIAEEAGISDFGEASIQIQELRNTGFVWTAWKTGPMEFGHNNESHHTKHTK